MTFNDVVWLISPWPTGRQPLSESLALLLSFVVHKNPLPGLRKLTITSPRRILQKRNIYMTGGKMNVAHDGTTDEDVLHRALRGDH